MASRSDRARRCTVGAGLAGMLAFSLCATAQAQNANGAGAGLEAGPQPAAALPASGDGAAGRIAASGIAVVSRERILREARAARGLREAEEALAQHLQRQIDTTKAAFAAEEEELARMRGTLADAEFEARVTDFDRRVRLARRNAQERAAALQKSFQDARAAIAGALPPLLERLRVDAGAMVVLNAEQVLALDPALDLTDRAIVLLDQQGPAPSIPEFDLSVPLTASPDTSDASVPSPEAAGGPVGEPDGARGPAADPNGMPPAPAGTGPAGQPPAR